MTSSFEKTPWSPSFPYSLTASDPTQTATSCSPSCSTNKQFHVRQAEGVQLSPFIQPITPSLYPVHTNCVGISIDMLADLALKPQEQCLGLLPEKERVEERKQEHDSMHVSNPPLADQCYNPQQPVCNAHRWFANFCGQRFLPIIHPLSKATDAVLHCWICLPVKPVPIGPARSL